MRPIARPSRRVAFAPLAVAGAFACSGATETVNTPPPASVLGCYAVTLGRWSAPRESADPPSRFRLLDSLGTNLLERDRLLVRPVDPQKSHFDFFEYTTWRRPETAPDSLEVRFSTGYVAIVLSMRWRNGAWRGRADAFTDVSPGLEATASARLRAEACPG